MSGEEAAAPIRVYLDACCLCRIFDDQTQERVRAEVEAVRRVLEGADLGRWEWVASDVLETEVARTPDPARRGFLLEVVGSASRLVKHGEQQLLRARRLTEHGVALVDALHVACAEAGGAEAFLTVDDVLLRRLHRIRSRLGVRALNPREFVGEV
ncbi:MAG: PIN domain-containing protein [Anaerolineae bacterium]